MKTAIICGFVFAVLLCAVTSQAASIVGGNLTERQITKRDVIETVRDMVPHSARSVLDTPVRFLISPVEYLAQRAGIIKKDKE